MTGKPPPASPTTDRSEDTAMQMSRDDLMCAYRTMRTIRVFEERIHREFAAGGIPGFVHLYAGQEASAVGVCMHLSDADNIASTHRGHGHCIAKGCDVTGMMSEIFGKRDGLCRGKGGSMHIADIERGMLGANGIVGGGAPLACGAALTSQVLGTDAVAVVFSGDGGSNQGALLESLNLASVWKLPVLFVIEDNGYAEATPSSWALAGDLLKRAEGFGMPGWRVDGHDFFAVHDAAGEAIARARTGEGPGLIHVQLGRFYGHFEGDAMTYRAAGEIGRLRSEQDCLARFRGRVVEAGLVVSSDLDSVDDEVRRLVDASTLAAKASEAPAAADLLADVYLTY